MQDYLENKKYFVLMGCGMWSYFYVLEIPLPLGSMKSSFQIDGKRGKRKM